MTETQPAPAGSGVSADVAELDRALTRIAYLLTRNRRNGLTTTAAGVPLDRAAVTVLLELADSGAMRPGELAARLEVEAPHVTRQVQRLEKAGYAARGADPDDRRAQLIQLTPSGTAAAGRIREVGRSGMQAALAHWSPDTLHQFATLFNRMVDDFLAYDAEQGPEARLAREDVRVQGGGRVERRTDPGEQRTLRFRSTMFVTNLFLTNMFVRVQSWHREPVPS